MLLKKPNNKKSEMPLAAAAMSFPGCARAIATSSSIVLTFMDNGVETASTTSDTLAIGLRSRFGSKGSVSCWYGSTLKVPAGPNHMV